MRLLECAHCGSKELIEKGGFLVCSYCKSRYVLEADDTSAKDTEIGLAADVKALLKKCKDDPANRRRYANLVLDIDPSNREARQYLA